MTVINPPIPVGSFPCSVERARPLGGHFISCHCDPRRIGMNAAAEPELLTIVFGWPR